jgi:hypothetical protein
MTAAADVHEGRHKLATAVDHLARYAPRLNPTLYPQRWEQLASHPWRFLLGTVDTVDARWSIQHRTFDGAEIFDGAVLDLPYGLLRVVPGGRCLECKHPYDPELALKQRAQRWGQDLERIRRWTAENVAVTGAMIERMALTQNKLPEDTPSSRACHSVTSRRGRSAARRPSVRTSPAKHPSCRWPRRRWAFSSPPRSRSGRSHRRRSSTTGSRTTWRVRLTGHFTSGGPPTRAARSTRSSIRAGVVSRATQASGRR